jgi:hypothetical protein
MDEFACVASEFEVDTPMVAPCGTTSLPTSAPTELNVGKQHRKAEQLAVKLLGEGRAPIAALRDSRRVR